LINGLILLEMSRPLRIQYPGAWYHIMNRGACRKPVFHTNQDRTTFLNLLGEITQIYNIEIHAFCLMSNHYHLLLHTPEGNLADAMKHLNSVYTMRFNKAHHADGSLFRGRYKSILVELEAYGLELNRYIHMNPVKAGIVSEPQHYQWSSYTGYLNQNQKHEWLKTAIIRNYFPVKSWSQAFHNFTIKRESDTIENNITGPSSVCIMGSDSFKRRVKKDNHYEDISFEVSERVQLKPTLAEILEAVASEFSVNTDSLTGKKRGYENPARTIAMVIAKNIFGYTLKEIASVMMLKNRNSVSARICETEKKLLESKKLCAIYESILSKLKGKI